MKNSMKAFGIAVLLSGTFAVNIVSAQTTPATETTTKSSSSTTPDKGTPTTTTTTKTTTTDQPSYKTNDKILGKDAKGNKVYQGPNGVKYFINSKGKKVTLAKDADVTPAPVK